MKVRRSEECNKRFHLGIICRCKIGEKIGIINGVKRHPYNGLKEIYEQKYFYFYKGEDYVIPQDTVVFYYSQDYNDFSPEAKYVTPFDQIRIEADSRTAYRVYDDDCGCLHDDNCWNKIINGIPYLCVCPYCMVFPVIKQDRNGHKFCHLITTVFSSLEDYFIRCYKGILNCKYEYKQNEYDNLEKFIEDKSRYIDTLDVETLISSYYVVRQEQLQRRPGKDDQYFIYRVSHLDSTDSYLQYLLPSKKDLIDYDLNWCSASDEDNTGIYVLQEETELLRNNARSQYTKARHLAFLVEEFLDKKKKNDIKLADLRNKLTNFIVPHDGIDFNKSKSENYIDLINLFNSNKTIIRYN